MKVVLPMKFMSLGCSMVTLRSETLLYINSPEGSMRKKKLHARVDNPPMSKENIIALEIKSFYLRDALFEIQMLAWIAEN